MIKKLLFFILSICSFAFAFAAVNINTANQQELETLNGIGPAKAKAIVDYRTQNGPFKSIEDIKSVKGVGEKIFEKIKEELSISGTATRTTTAAVPAKKSKTVKKDQATAGDKATKTTKKDNKKSTTK